MKTKTSWGSIFFVLILIFILWADTGWACSNPDPNKCNQITNNNNDANAQAVGVGIGTGIADSTAISGSNSAAIVGVSSDNTNTNLNAPVAIGGGADVDNKVSNSNANVVKTDVQNTNIIMPTVTTVMAPNIAAGAVSGSYSGPSTSQVGDTIANAGDSQATNTTNIGDNISGAEAYSEGATSSAQAGDSISDVNMGDINAGNSFSSSYFNSEKLDSVETSVQVGSVRKSVPNISGYAGMNRYNYRDSWEFGVRMTIPLFTGVTDKALEHESNKIEAEKNYLNAQIAVMNAAQTRDEEAHRLAIDRATMDIALLCEPFLQGLVVIDKSNSGAYSICKNYDLKKPKEVEKIVEKEVIKRVYIEKKDPCANCPKPIIGGNTASN